MVKKFIQVVTFLIKELPQFEIDSKDDPCTINNQICFFIISLKKLFSNNFQTAFVDPRPEPYFLLLFCM